MPIEYIEPTPSARTRILITLGVLVLVVAIGQFAIFPFVNSLPPCDSLVWNKRILVAEMVVFILFALWQRRSIWRVVRARQWPLPGADVYFRTRIYRGWRLAAVICGLAAWPILVIWLTIQFGPMLFRVLVESRCAA
jgi:hypothetical protein